MSQNYCRKDTETQTLAICCTQELLVLFECPVCYEYILPPIYQCNQGHLICSSCKSKVNHCPSCREELGTIRCLVMEKVANKLLFPCRYSSQGCQVMLLRTNKPHHEEIECNFRPFNCPYTFIEKCGDWQGSKEEVMEHLLKKHEDNFKKEHGVLKAIGGPLAQLAPFVSPLDYSAETSTISWMWTYVQYCFNCTFVLNLYYIHNGNTNVHFATVRIADNIENARKYRYLISLEGQNGCLSYEGRCHSLHEDVKAIYQTRDCLCFDLKTAQKFVNEEVAEEKVLCISVKLMSPEDEPTSKFMCSIRSESNPTQLIN